MGGGDKIAEHELSVLVSVGINSSRYIIISCWTQKASWFPLEDPDATAEPDVPTLASHSLLSTTLPTCNDSIPPASPQPSLQGLTWTGSSGALGSACRCFIERHHGQFARLPQTDTCCILDLKRTAVGPQVVFTWGIFFSFQKLWNISEWTCSGDAGHQYISHKH